MKYVTIGTAGHVDHGKTLLIRALTGVDTDRLKEEKERGISIELGFAYLDLPSGIRAGIIDVPGHERFIKNMLAGIGGIDIVLLVVAADEGIMPQTREHMDIIQVLGIKRGVVVISKIDLVDQEWLDLVEEEVRGYIATTSLGGAPIVPVSAVTGDGLKELVAVVDELVQAAQERPATGAVRLPIDRVFTIAGFGTVVTGTLVSGTIKEGDSLAVLPQSVMARVRSLQVHKEKISTARAGRRVAVNLAGLERQAVTRGNVLATPGFFTPSTTLDGRIFLLKSARPLKNRARVRVHIGTSEITGRVVLLDRDELAPEASCYAQFILEEPIVAGRRDRFVLRSVSPVTTIGGGLVLEPVARRHKRFRKDVLDYLETVETGSPAAKVAKYLDTARAPVEAGGLSGAVGLDESTVERAIAELAAADRIRVIDVDNQRFLIDTEFYAELARRIGEIVALYHRDYPLREGYPREELRSRLFAGVGSRVFQGLLQKMAEDGVVAIQPQVVTSVGFTGEPPAEVRSVLAALEEIYRKAGFQPPRWEDAVAQLAVAPESAVEYLTCLMRAGILVKLSEEQLIHREALREAQEIIVGTLHEKAEISLGEVRDLLNTSRKHALPLLEYLDSKRVTKRMGDKRVLMKR
ncbi:MAG: selenocysteine-specific translation elongation factor [Ammonifex sp.]|nr:MAG: selenocysteine-specific translation elongation factor [Ammonifex sp.]